MILILWKVHQPSTTKSPCYEAPAFRKLSANGDSDALLEESCLIQLYFQRRKTSEVVNMWTQAFANSSRLKSEQCAWESDSVDVEANKLSDQQRILRLSQYLSVILWRWRISHPHELSSTLTFMFINYMKAPKLHFLKKSERNFIIKLCRRWKTKLIRFPVNFRSIYKLDDWMKFS